MNILLAADGSESHSLGRAAFVKQEAIDLIVMGSHGHGAFASFALGSTAARLLATVKTPVVIVR